MFHINFFFISVSPATMWTKKEIVEFKESVRKEGGESIIKVQTKFK